MLKLYNTQAGKKEPLRPLRPGRVRIYVCGVTVYDRCHLGHARSAIVFDVVRRYLEYKRYKVRFVKNFTDVDDKIIHRAQQEGRPWLEVAETYIRAYHEDMGRLGIRSADVEPRATEYIGEMIRLIRRLIQKKVAYESDGNVFYRVRSFPKYGRLSKRRLSELQAGARVEVDERKEDPLDFALWKASKPGEPAWDSPWGSGRPGWHIECSAMALRLLASGTSGGLDIHGGGKDLIFPHHENEIAQSEAATGRRFSKYWIHNGFVNVNREKMSKSLGNFFTIQEIFEKSPWPEAVTAEVLRYFLVSTHYRSPIDFSDKSLKAAKGGLDNFYRMFQKLEEPADSPPRPAGGELKLRGGLKKFPARFEKAMDDDFNTAAALSELQKLRASVNAVLDRGLSRTLSRETIRVFRKFGGLLGLFALAPGQWTESREAPAGLSPGDVERLVEERNEARRAKDWARADVLRKQLAAAGVILEDRPDGTTRVRR